MEKLNLTISEGYPTHSTDTSALSGDQSIKVPHDVYSEKIVVSRSKVSYWPNKPVKLNSSFIKIARQSLTSGSLSSWPIAHQTLRNVNGRGRPETQPLFVTSQQGLVAV